MKIEAQAGKNRLTTESGVIYLCCPSEGDPIYIGQTVDWVARRRAHAGGAWWPEVSHIDFIPAPDGDERLGAERALIRTFNPKYNVIESTNPRRVGAGPMPFEEAMAALAEERKISREQLRLDLEGFGPVEIAPFGFARSRRQARGKSDAEWWTHHDVAAYLGVHVSTSALYEPGGHVPPRDATIAGRAAWRPATIMSILERDSGPIRHRRRYPRRQPADLRGDDAD